MKWMHDTVLSTRFWLGKPKYQRQQSQLSVTVVIPAWNEQQYIAKTIESVLAQDYPLKLIVVNDRSTDRTGEIAASYDNVQVINVEQKAGSKSQALNKALPYVDSEIFVCVDADTELDPNSLGKLMQAFNNPNVYVASGVVTAKHGDNFWQSARSGEYIIGQGITKSAQENLNAVLVASGCFFAIRTELLRKHQFDNRTMAEDMDLTWTAVEQGYDVAFVQDARCYVTDPDTWPLYHKQLYRWYAGLFQCIKQRNYNLFVSTKLGIAVYFYLLAALIGVPVAFTFITAGALTNIGATVVLLCGLYTLTLIIGFVYGMVNRQSVVGYPRFVFCMMLSVFINYGILIQAAVNELIRGNTLVTWVKGH